ncbi:MAG TPA: response regulator transcription factor [Desulfobacterales bacterium]|nr:response regulator transcription factor [Desulfobacterales bacterium]
MDKTTAVIAEDEEPLRVWLKTMLGQVWPELVICGDAENGLQALSLIETERPDIAFLDIKMPGLTGLQVAENTAGICRVVFITAFEQYAVEAFEKEAIDYLLKPVTAKRLEKTVDRLKQRLSGNIMPDTETAQIMKNISQLIESASPREYLQWIRVSNQDGVRLIHAEDICYFQSSDKYTAVITAEGESLIKKTIRELELELDPGHFWRIHRSTIVNVRCIAGTSRSAGGHFIRLKNCSEILTVSRTYAHLFKQM